MWDVSAAARADRPFEVWAPWTTAYATWTTVRDDQDDVMWAATVEGVVVGMAGLGMPHVDNQHVAATELFVHPDHRRRGIGAALLATVVDRSRAGGRTVLMTSPYSPVDRPGAGEEFLTAHGFELGIAEMSQVCDLVESEPTWPALAAQIAPQHADYRLEAWQDRIPEPFVEGYCRLGEAFNDEAPLGDLDLGAEVWSAERVARARRPVHRDRPPPVRRARVRPRRDVRGHHRAVRERRRVVARAPGRHPRAAGPPRPPARPGPQAGQPAGGPRALPRTAGTSSPSSPASTPPMNAVNDLLGFRDVERALEMQRRL